MSSLKGKSYPLLPLGRNIPLLDPWAFVIGNWNMHSGRSFLDLLVSDRIERFLTSRVRGKPLSYLYLCLSLAYDTRSTHIFQHLWWDVPELTEESWEDCVSTYVTSAKDRFIQLTFLHRVHYTPQRLASIYPQSDRNCARCAVSTGTFIHMVWSCPVLMPFWKLVTHTLGQLCNIPLHPEPLFNLLGYMEDRGRSIY